MAHNTNQSISGKVHSFSTYVDELYRTLAREDLGHLISSSDANLYRLLNGKAADVLHETVPITARREQGIFFTNHALADRIASDLSSLLQRGVRISDPACGAGNLLLACANYLPIGTSFEETVDIWSDLIHGCDVFEEFVVATKLRLALLAAVRSSDARHVKNAVSRLTAFGGLRARDVLADGTLPEPVDCTIVNPPYGNAKAPDQCRWASGNVQKAAIFLEQIMRSASQEQRVIAVLPDVLRSGTRYSRWREVVSRLASSVTVEIVGRFDAEADVDVFVLSAIVGDGCDSIDWTLGDNATKNARRSVSDFFHVHAGAVVPHRDKVQGPDRPYIRARSIPAWKTVEAIGETRQYSGTVFRPPFVALNRTSSPRDRCRCIGTIVNADREVAVENHLLVLLPRDGSLEKCDELLRVLKNESTTKWMNHRIRCRHLTVASVRELPWWSEQ